MFSPRLLAAATLVVALFTGTIAVDAVAQATTRVHGPSATRRSVAAVVPSTSGLGLLAAAERASAAASTSASGPYGVGVVHTTVVDTTRGTAPRGDTPGSPVRALALTILYPASTGVGATDTDNAAPAFGRFPLVVFAHGYDASAATYATLEHQLAAAGFVVVAPDFPLTSSALAGPAVEDDVSNQAADVSFVITTVLDPATSPAGLATVIAPGEVGVVGHSDGGVTAAAVAFNSTVADRRVGAAVVLSGAEARYDGTWFTTQSPPLLAVHGTDDEVNPYASSTQLVADATGPKYLASVDGGSHLGPFTTDASEPDVARLAADFLHAYLTGDAAALARLPADGNVAGELALTS